MAHSKSQRIGCLLLVIVVPFLEAGLIILTVKWLGAFQAYALLLGASVAGLLLVGISMARFAWKLRKLKTEIARMKSEEAAGGTGIDLETLKKKMATEIVTGMAPYFFALFFFLVPGFITDAFGFWLISPFSRNWFANAVKGKVPPPKRPGPGGGGPSFSYTPRPKARP